MSAARLLAAIAGLILGLLFYVAFRCDQTLGNRLVAGLWGERYPVVKDALRHGLALPPVLLGCMPSGLWCFVGSCLCSGWRVRFGKAREMGLAWLFPSLNALWEAVQGLGWTDGRADAADVLAGLVGGALSCAIFRFRHPEQRPAALVVFRGWRLGLLLVGVSTMGLADVWP